MSLKQEGVKFSQFVASLPHKEETTFGDVVVLNGKNSLDSSFFNSSSDFYDFAKSSSTLTSKKVDGTKTTYYFGKDGKVKSGTNYQMRWVSVSKNQIINFKLENPRNECVFGFSDEIPDVDSIVDVVDFITKDNTSIDKTFYIEKDCYFVFVVYATDGSRFSLYSGMSFSNLDELKGKVNEAKGMVDFSYIESSKFNGLQNDVYINNVSFRVNDVIASDSNDRLYAYKANKGDIFSVEYSYQTDSVGFGFCYEEPKIGSNIKVYNRNEPSQTLVTKTDFFVIEEDGYFVTYHYATRESSTVVKKGSLFDNLLKKENFEKYKENFFGCGFMVPASVTYGEINDRGGVKVKTSSNYRIDYKEVKKGDRYIVKYYLKSDKLKILFSKKKPSTEIYYAEKIILISDEIGNGNIVLDAEDDGFFIVSTYATSSSRFYSYIGINELLESVLSIPNSLEEYIEKRVDDVNKMNYDLGSRNDKFIFITDSHFGSALNMNLSPNLINRILSETGVNKLFWGGDSIVASSADGVNQLFIQSNKLTKTFKKALVPGSSLYTVQGNHDFHITDTDSSSFVGYSQAKTRNILFENVPDNICADENHPEDTYYYFDNNLQKIRYMIWQESSNTESSQSLGVSGYQIEFFKNAVLNLQNGWKIISFGHIPCYAWTGENSGSVSDVYNFLKAINEKSNVELKGVSCDFSSLSNISVLMYVSGHTHRDLQTYASGILMLNTASDAAYADCCKSPYFSNAVSRGQGQRNYGLFGDQYLSLFDVVGVDVNNGVIDVKRIGSYFDRRFNLNKIECNVGESVNLISKLSGSLSWHYYNIEFDMSGSTLQDNGDGTYNAIYSQGLDDSERLSLSDGGTVNGLNPGEVVVLAIDENQNKEFWNVKVV